uniref:Uncharacterized protein n=1 Tax=Fibrocapsa japonica TaxID=94617 RepID=A0A7S2V0E5_9STRA|mmetsp:Transcript_23141/g.33620  ORF Transcript_23141/g.33620 Transcript_23141/m.33620 type:complete len:219 (+) Transcript_23141:2-658(+)
MKNNTLLVAFILLGSANVIHGRGLKFGKFLSCLSDCPFEVEEALSVSAGDPISYACVALGDDTSCLSDCSPQIHYYADSHGEEPGEAEMTPYFPCTAGPLAGTIIYEDQMTPPLDVTEDLGFEYIYEQTCMQLRCFGDENLGIPMAFCDAQDTCYSATEDYINSVGLDEDVVECYMGLIDNLVQSCDAGGRELSLQSNVQLSTVHKNIRRHLKLEFYS